ncbi:hypothetical protein AALP_AA1G283600 [Arabis alpina]|uniref:Uncharacterized protein n=1 Tax=Arabis alpina TaxID=50452 RepID=A0A087HR78_ARAAL|nr:hypothetical protein AALP_AA1G283600 [Arabis alpina]
MESSEDAEVLTRAIEKFLHEKKKRVASGDPIIEDHQDQLLLSSLISQLESSKPGGKTTIKEEECPASKGKGEDLEEIAKDIKEVKKQNKVTHILLSVLIILTLTWQVSEYSMISMMKDRISHPIRSIGGMFSGMFKGKMRLPDKKQTSNSKAQNNHNNSGGVPMQVPEMLQDLAFNNDEE